MARDLARVFGFTGLMSIRLFSKAVMMGEQPRAWATAIRVLGGSMMPIWASS